MKKLYLLYLLALPLVSPAQSIHRAWQSGFANELYALVPTADGHWLVGGAVGDPTLSFSNGYFAELDASGQTIHETSFNLLERTVVTALLPLPDGRFVVGGYGEGCDFGYSGFVALYNTDGTREWLTFPDFHASGEEIVYVSRLLATADGNILAVGSGKAQLFDLNSGLEQNETELPGYYHDVANGPDSLTAWLSGSNGIALLNLQDLSLQPIVPWGNTQDAYWQIAADQNGRFYTYRQKSDLLLTGNTGGPTDSLILDFKVHDIFVQGSDVFLCGRQGLWGRVERRDSTLQLIKGFDLASPDYIPRRVRPFGDEVALAGMELHGPPPRTYPSEETSRNFWLQSFASDGSTGIDGTDVAITEVIIDSIPKATFHNDGPFGGYWSVTASDVRVRVVNSGTQVLQKVQIASSGYGQDIFYICFLYSQLSRTFDNLNLQPGESVVLPLGDIYTLFTQSIKPWRLCIWATTPNELADTDHENDYSCVELDLTSATVDLAAAQLKLYPNPADDVIILENLQERSGLCRVFDSSGQLVSEQVPGLKNGNYQLIINQLPSGLYFLETTQGWGRFVKK